MPTFPYPAQDQDDFGLKQAKIMNLIDSDKSERDAGGKPVPTFPHPAQDQDDFGLKQAKIMNLIDSDKSERDAGGKPVPTFPHPALGRISNDRRPT